MSYAGLVVAFAAVAVPGSALARSGKSVTDALGTRAASVMEAHPSSGSLTASAYCAPYFADGGGFSTSLGGGWSSLAARSEPCRAAPSQGTWYNGQTFWVYRKTKGEFICRGRYTYGYASNVWCKTSKGWSWPGGTSNPVWNGSC